MPTNLFVSRSTELDYLDPMAYCIATKYETFGEWKVRTFFHSFNQNNLYFSQTINITRSTTQNAKNYPASWIMAQQWIICHFIHCLLLFFIVYIYKILLRAISKQNCLPCYSSALWGWYIVLWRCSIERCDIIRQIDSTPSILAAQYSILSRWVNQRLQ